MSRPFSIQRHAAQCGFTIIELMVAMTIGLLIGLVVFAAYTSSIGTQRAQTDISRLEESARFGFDLLARAARRAGYRDTTSAYPLTYAGQRAKEFCSTDPTGAEIQATNDPADVDLGGGVKPAVLNLSDTITVRYYGQDNPAHNDADGVVLDCLGNTVRRGGGKADGSPVQDIIYVAADPANNNEPTLFCKTDNPTAGVNNNLALIPGVESMQLVYAEDTDGDTVANRYVPSNKVTSWDDVRGVLISFVVRTPNTTGADRTSKTFLPFGPDYDAAGNDDSAGGGFTSPTATDGRVRLQFSNYISLRNFSVCN